MRSPNEDSVGTGEPILGTIELQGRQSCLACWWYVNQVTSNTKVSLDIVLRWKTYLRLAVIEDG
jgi:hypothetical protein